MVKLERIEALNRKLRREAMPELTVSTWELVRGAIKQGKMSEALELIDYGCSESMALSVGMGGVMESLITYIAEHFGEEEVEKAWREMLAPRAKKWLETTPGVVETLQRELESQRALYADKITLTEDDEKWMLSYHPCGSGGRLWMMGKMGLTQKPHPWSWSRKGVPYYCAHCAMGKEIIPIELRGYPIRIHVPGEKPGDPCVQFFYKKPELIPEEYFARVGKAKTIK